MPNKPYEDTGDYIPRTDEGFLSWSGGFSEKISQDPLRFGLTHAQSDEILLWAGRYRDSYYPAQGPGSRTPQVVLTKKEARRGAERIMRRYAQYIKKRPDTTLADLSVLGLHLDDPTNTRIGAPQSAPLLKLKMMGNADGHILYYGDRSTPDAKRKPHGIERIQLYVHIGPRVNYHVTGARELGSYGKQPIRVYWPASESGLTVTYFGRWETRTGLKGPWSLPVHMLIATGGAMSKEVLSALREAKRAA